MCIEDEAAGKLQTMRIVKEIEVGLIPFLLNFHYHDEPWSSFFLFLCRCEKLGLTGCFNT